MDIILNETSFKGQFKTLEDFAEYFVKEVNPMLDIIIEKNILMYKKSDMYSMKITKDKSIGDIFRISNNTPITILKGKIAKIMYSSPHWDTEDLRTVTGTEYEYLYKCDEPNCFTEAIERECPILSLKTDDYIGMKLECYKDKKKILLDNIEDQTGLLSTYFRYSRHDIKYVMEKYPFEMDIVLTEVDGKCFAEEALLKNELISDDFDKIFKNIPNLISDRLNGKKSHWWDIIEGMISEYRISISGNREFRLFFCTGR